MSAKLLEHFIWGWMQFLHTVPARAAPAIQPVQPTLARRPYQIVTALSSILLSLLIGRCHITKPRTFQCFSSTTIIFLFVVYGVIEPSYQLFLPAYRLNDGTSFGNKLILNSMRHTYPYTKSCILLSIVAENQEKKWEWYARVYRKGLNRPIFIRTWFSIFKIWTKIVCWILDQTINKISGKKSPNIRYSY